MKPDKTGCKIRVPWRGYLPIARPRAQALAGHRGGGVLPCVAHLLPHIPLPRLAGLCAQNVHPLLHLGSVEGGVRKDHSVRLELSFRGVGPDSAAAVKVYGVVALLGPHVEEEAKPSPKAVSHRTCWNILGHSLNHTRKSYM